MQFESRYEDLTFGDNTVRLTEMSAAQFASVMDIENEQEQLMQMVWTCLEHKPDEISEMFHWPVNVINQLIETCLELNGLKQGN